MKSWVLVLGCCLVLCSCADAEIVPTPGTQDLQTVFDNSDLVCTGTVRATRFTRSEWAETESGRLLRRYSVAEISVNEVYKSNVAPTAGVSLEYVDDQLTKGEGALLFLTSGGSSNYTLADPFIGITEFTFLPTASKGTGIRMLESALSQIVQRANQQDQVNALKMLQGFPALSQSTRSSLDRLLNSPNSEIALAAFAVILKAGDAEHVEKLRTYIREYHAENEPPSILSIGSELGHVRDEAALASLSDLSGSGILSVRIGAMQALRAIRSPRAAPFLVRRLDDKDGYVQYLAVISLAEIFNKDSDYAPSMYLFDRNPAFYLNLWKSWWTAEGRAYQPTTTP